MKHHYVPQFLLRRWTNAAGKLYVFSKHGGRLRSAERAPRSTGFVEGLYAIVAGALGLSENHVERKLFGTIDNNAAVALSKLETHEAFTPDDQIAWTFFLSSLRIRQPDTLRFLRTAAMDYVRQTVAAKDKATLPAGQPSTVQWFEQNFPDGLEAKSLISWLPRMITHGGVLDAFESLLWFTREFAADVPKLLLADMPLHWDTGLNDPELLIQLPLGPNRVFIGTRTEESKQMIEQMPAHELVRRINCTSLASSVTYVWASEEDEARVFIEENLDIMGVNALDFAQVVLWGA